MDMAWLHGNKHYVIARCYMTWLLIKKHVFLEASSALVSRISVARLTILLTNEGVHDDLHLWRVAGSSSCNCETYYSFTSKLINQLTRKLVVIANVAMALGSVVVQCRWRTWVCILVCDFLDWFPSWVWLWIIRCITGSFLPSIGIYHHLNQRRNFTKITSTLFRLAISVHTCVQLRCQHYIG